MRVLRVRVLIVLSLIYLGLVGLIYQYLWRAHGLDNSIDSLFDSPGHSQQGNDDIVQFNFRRGNGFSLHLTNTTDNITVPPNRTLLTTQGKSHPVIIKSENMLYDISSLGPPNYCIHTFYYMWYGDPESDGKYVHWNHEYIPHWKQDVTDKYPKGRHEPPDDIGASFYPELGPYSSNNPHTIETHMYQLRKAGVGVVSVSWYPMGTADDEGGPPDEIIPQLLDIANKYSIKVTIHIEPYKKRTPHTVRKDFEYIHSNYGNHPAFYKLARGDRTLPLIYVYDSYLIPAKDWSTVLTAGGDDSIRGTSLDCIVIGLLVEERHKLAITQAGFDGFYTYFASDRFSYGSTIKKWPLLEKFAREKGLIFIPSFGPGYDDERVRPWNKVNSKPRQNGDYYTAMYKAAVANGYMPRENYKLVSLTSFNEWHEGTQIESAVPKTFNKYTYLDYSPRSPDYYLELTMQGSVRLECYV